MNVAVQVSRMRRHPNPKMSIKDPTTTTTVVVSPVRAVLPPVWLYTRMILLTGGLFWRSSEDATLGFHQFGFDILHVGSPPPYRSQQQNGQWPGSHSATFQKKIKEKDVAGSLAVKDYVAIWVAMLSPGSFAAGPHPQPFLFFFFLNFFFPTCVVSIGVERCNIIRWWITIIIVTQRQCTSLAAAEWVPNRIAVPEAPIPVLPIPARILCTRPSPAPTR